MRKRERQNLLLRIIDENPFLKDDELAEKCSASISTIRNDRAELGIAEYRQRIKTAAEHEFLSGSSKEELLDIDLYNRGMSVLETDVSMAFENTRIVKSQYIYAFAENLAISVVNAKAALVRVANVKYVSEAYAGEKLVAKSTVARARSSEYIVHVFINNGAKEIFRGKFSLTVKGNSVRND